METEKGSVSDSGSNIGILAVMDATGDTRHIWTVGNRTEEDAARSIFNELKKKGYMAYRVDGADKGTVMKDFDNEAGKMIMAPPVQGG